MALAPVRCLLSKRLKERGMTQQELADKIGMHQSQLSDYANGRRVMTLKTAKTIADALKCHIDDLYEWVCIRQ